MAYTKGDMVFADYRWTAAADFDNPKYIGFPDNIILNRREGFEMLHFINKCAVQWRWGENIAACQRLEILIRTLVPNHLKSHANIYYWIVTNQKSI